MGELGGFHQRLRVCVSNSGLVVKEVAARAGVNKRTLDKWLSPSDPKMPGAIDAVAVAQVLGVSVEFLATGEGPSFVPSRLVPIVEDLSLLSPERLEDVARLIRPWADEARAGQKREIAAG